MIITFPNSFPHFQWIVVRSPSICVYYLQHYSEEAENPFLRHFYRIQVELFNNRSRNINKLFPLTNFSFQRTFKGRGIVQRSVYIFMARFVYNYFTEFSKQISRNIPRCFAIVTSKAVFVTNCIFHCDE